MVNLALHIHTRHAAKATLDDEYKKFPLRTRMRHGRKIKKEVKGVRISSSL
jgi:hypothetical protein